jgi:hypothetical protein
MMAISKEMKAFIDGELDELAQMIRQELDKAPTPEERAVWKAELIRQFEAAFPGLKVAAGE